MKFFPDGRSVVDTIGVSRFKVLSHGQRDGYHTAKIEYLEDKKVGGLSGLMSPPLDEERCPKINSLYHQVEAAELVELLKMHDSVYEQASSWFTSLKDNMKSQILSHFGHLPSKDSDPQVGADGSRLQSRPVPRLLAVPSVVAGCFLREALVSVSPCRPLPAVPPGAGGFLLFFHWRIVPSSPSSP